MIRLDKYLANLGFGTRSTLPYMIKEGRVKVNDTIQCRPDSKVHIGDELELDGVLFEVKTDVTILLYKPAGYVCSEVAEGGFPSYKELLKGCVYANILHVAGRLDVDTTGLVICSSNGGLVHSIISPKTHVEKSYVVTCREVIDDASLRVLREGVTLEDGYRTLPSQTQRLSDVQFRLVLHEGKFHQVKRMLEAVGNQVVALDRERIGPWSCERVLPGEWCYLHDAQNDLKDRQKKIM